MARNFHHFYILLCNSGLFEYMVEKTLFESETCLKPGKCKRPLLYYAVSPFRDRTRLGRRWSSQRLLVALELPYELTNMFPCIPEAVALLLNLGGNPNEEVDGTIIWMCALRGGYLVLVSQAAFGDKVPAFPDHKVCFVKAGADPRVRIQA